MINKYGPGAELYAWTTATDNPVILRGARVVVVSPLDEDEYDREEVGPMYEVMVKMQVFEDELTEYDPMITPKEGVENV